MCAGRGTQVRGRRTWANLYPLERSGPRGPGTVPSGRRARGRRTAERPQRSRRDRSASLILIMVRIQLVHVSDVTRDGIIRHTMSHVLTRRMIDRALPCGAHIIFFHAVTVTFLFLTLEPLRIFRPPTARSGLHHARTPS